MIQTNKVAELQAGTSFPEAVLFGIPLNWKH